MSFFIHYFFIKYFIYIHLLTQIHNVKIIIFIIIFKLCIWDCWIFISKNFEVWQFLSNKKDFWLCLGSVRRCYCASGWQVQLFTCFVHVQSLDELLLLLFFSIIGTGIMFRHYYYYFVAYIVTTYLSRPSDSW